MSITFIGLIMFLGIYIIILKCISKILVLYKVK